MSVAYSTNRIRQWPVWSSRSEILNSRMRSEGIWVVGGQAARAVGLLVGVRVLTELTGPEVYGTVSLLTGGVALG